MKITDGGVCAPAGFKAAGIHCGMRKNTEKKDLALIVSENLAAAAAVYTTNLVKGAPIEVTRRNISDGYAQAVICNSGNANTCNADGIQKAEAMCSLVEKHTGIKSSDVIVASTGVIGAAFDITPIEKGMDELVSSLSYDSDAAVSAIMTTDTVQKQIAVEFEIDGITCRMGAAAKGSGMINPNMATMLAFITTDAAVAPHIAAELLAEDAADTFNMLSVDGDTSTNDMAAFLANGKAGNKIIDTKDSRYETLKEAYHFITVYLCRALAADGEGATKLLTAEVVNASDKQTARTAAKAVISSNLVKAAMFGEDANWGRILCAVGYSGADVDTGKIDVCFRSEKGTLEVCRNGMGTGFDEAFAKEVLSSSEIDIIVDLGCPQGIGAAAWGCDLTYDYVKINGDYRS